MPGGMRQPEPEGDIFARIRCPHGRWYVIYESCPETTGQETPLPAREPTRKEKRRFDRQLKRMLKDGPLPRDN